MSWGSHGPLWGITRLKQAQDTVLRYKKGQKGMWQIKISRAVSELPLSQGSRELIFWQKQLKSRSEGQWRNNFLKNPKLRTNLSIVSVKISEFFFTH